MKIQFFIW